MATRLTTWNPVREAMTLRDAMDRLFEDSYVQMPQGGNGNGHGKRCYTPRADAWETDEAVVIELVLPGADPANVDVTFEADTLQVSGEITLPDEDERSWVLRERPRGRFERRFSLNVLVDGQKIDAAFKDGVLSLNLPKREEVKPRKIAVHAAE